MKGKKYLLHLKHSKQSFDEQTGKYNIQHSVQQPEVLPQHQPPKQSRIVIIKKRIPMTSTTGAKGMAARAIRSDQESQHILSELGGSASASERI